MKDSIKDAITILEDIKASYYTDKFIKERLSTAIKLLNKSRTQHFWHIPTTTEVKLKKLRTAIIKINADSE